MGDIDLSDDFKNLCSRMRDLKGYQVRTNEDARTLVAMWDALADDFEEEHHKVNAEMCRKNASRVRQKFAIPEKPQEAPKFPVLPEF